MKKLLTLLLLMPLVMSAQENQPPIYVDQSGFIKLRPNYRYLDSVVYNFISKDTTVLNVIPKDTVVLNVVPKDTTILRIAYRDTLIYNITYKDTCVQSTGPNDPGPVDPPPSTDLFTFSVQQNSNWNNVSIPFAKGEVWSGQWIAPQPYRAADKYFRFSWSMLEGAKDQYNWIIFDREFQSAINNGQKFSFGIMTHYPGAVSPHRLTYDGGYSVYPQYLHNMMQAEPVKDWRASNGAWVPNWNSDAYAERLLALHKAITDHIYEKGWQNWINYIDLRGYGSFGEWHSVDIASQMSQYPPGTRATEASLKRIIDIHTEGFPDWPLVVMIAAFDCDRLQNTMNPPGVAAYALRARNKWGLLGWRRDQWGATDSYLRQYTDQNTRVVDGMRLDTAIMNRWKYAPIVGEPCCHANFSDMLNQVNRYRPVSIGNGNFDSESTRNTNVTRALQAAGHKLTITGGTFKDGVITINWRNSGLTPIYEDFDTYFEFRSTTGQVITRKSASTVTLRQPGDWTTTDTITGLPAGTYDLHIVVKNDQRTYPLGITDSKVATIKL